MRTIVLAVLLLLVAAVFAATAPATQAVKRDASVVGQENVEGKESDEKTCIKYKHLKCTYVNKCVKAEEYCAEEVVKGQQCVKMGFEMVNEKKKVCKKLEAFDKFNLNKCYKCAEVGEEDIPVKKDKCEEFKPIKECIHYSSKCSEHKLLKRCYTEVNPLELEGPKECPVGKVLKFERKDNTITRSCVDAPKTAPKELFCRGYADPHMVNDKGQSFEFQQAGDFVYMKSKEGIFQCHLRLKSYGSWTGGVAFACRANGKDLIEYELGGKATLNGHSVALANGVKAMLPEGGYVLKNGNTVNVVGPNGCRFLFIEQGSYANIEAYHPADVAVEGLCAGAVKESAKGLFAYKYRSEFLPEAVVPLTFKSEEERQLALQMCKNRGLDEGARLERCLFDYANSPAGERTQILNTEKAEAKETDKQRADLVSQKK